MGNMNIQKHKCAEKFFSERVCYQRRGVGMAPNTTDLLSQFKQEKIKHSPLINNNILLCRQLHCVKLQ